MQNPNNPGTELFSIHTLGETLGIATSGIFKRQGVKGQVAWHHLIDPRTGLPVDNNILAVTAIAPDATRADVFAKTVLILGESAGLKFIERQPGSACIIFLKTKGIRSSERALRYF